MGHNVRSIAQAAGVSVATFIGGLLVFRKMEATFADLI